MAASTKITDVSEVPAASIISADGGSKYLCNIPEDGHLQFFYTI
jgi:hypothetical protein